MITFYEDKYYMFSNFSSFMVYYDKREWMTSEHAYQAMKFRPIWIQQAIKNQRSAHDAKKYAHANKDKYREDWDEIKLSVMTEICRAKLEQHNYIRKMLLKTGSHELVEASPKDAFWGWGRDETGENHLGKIWMKLREELINE